MSDNQNPSSIRQAWKETYALIAYNIDATFTDRYNGAYYAKQAVLSIVNLTANDENGYEAPTQLLPRMRDFYNWILHYWDIDERRKLVIYEVNKFTETYQGDLTTFVNDIDWTDGCVPYYWAQTTEQSLFDTLNWVVCS